MNNEPDLCFVSVDVEASGPIPGLYSMLSIGAVLVDDDKVAFSRLLKPTTDRFDAKAMSVSNLSLDALRVNGSDPAEAMRNFRDWTVEKSNGRTPVFVGLNAAFDWSFVNYYFQFYLSENPFGFAPLDIKAFYAGKTGSKWMDAKSSQMKKVLGAKRSPNHDALDDALAQAELFRLTVALG